jgi:hypothetical protein
MKHKTLLFRTGGLLLVALALACLLSVKFQWHIFGRFDYAIGFCAFITALFFVNRFEPGASVLQQHRDKRISRKVEAYDPKEPD